MEAHADISVSQYLSIAVSVAEASGNIIRDVYESGDLHAKDKGQGTQDKLADPVTIADLTVQKTIMENYGHCFPQLVTKGEESTLSMEGIQAVCKPEDLSDSFIQ